MMRTVPGADCCLQSDGMPDSRCQAFSKVWLDDAQIVAVCPFLLAGSFWEPLGWPWMEMAGAALKPLAVFAAIRELRCSRTTGGCPKRDQPERPTILPAPMRKRTTAE